MGYLTDEVLSEARSLGIATRTVAPTEMERLRDSIYARYTLREDASARPLHALVEEYESHQDPEGWKLLGDLIGHQNAILFFDASTDPGGITFSDGYLLEKTVGECTGFVFYVTSPDLSFLLCFDDHDMILAAGSMADRLNEIVGE